MAASRQCAKKEGPGGFGELMADMDRVTERSAVSGGGG